MLVYMCTLICVYIYLFYDLLLSLFVDCQYVHVHVNPVHFGVCLFLLFLIYYTCTCMRYIFGSLKPVCVVTIR